MEKDSPEIPYSRLGELLPNGKSENAFSPTGGVDTAIDTGSNPRPEQAG
jgi:hypothetical protein